MSGRTIGLCGDTGSGKTTLLGELAKYHYLNSSRRSRLYTSDMGGYQSILPYTKLGIVEVVPYNDDDDPWVWLENAVVGGDAEQTGPSLEGIAACFIDSGSSISDHLMADCARQALLGKNIGGRPAPKFDVKGKSGKKVEIGSNSDTHYGVVQSFVKTMINKSTFTSKRAGVDFVWTFGLYRGEGQTDAPVLGPKLAGKALTPDVPRWMDFFWRTVAITQLDASPIHRLYLQAHPEGMSIAFGNSRYPKDASTPLPPYVEPASIIEALRLIEQGQEEALANLKEEMGM